MEADFYRGFFLAPSVPLVSKDEIYLVSKVLLKVSPNLIRVF